MGESAQTIAMARLARGIGDVTACITLSDSAVQQATFEHDHVSAYLAAEVPGRMYMGRSEPRLAEAHYRYALDLLLMHGDEAHLGGAYHDLSLAVREAGDRKMFKDLSALAFRYYHERNPRDPGITGLLADRACDEFERNPADRDCAYACLNAWKAVPASMRTPHYRLTAAAHQMRASAVLGYRKRYADAADALGRFLAEMPDGEAVALILSFAARGALMMHDFKRAGELAEHAERKAVERGEAVPLEDARAVLDAAKGERAGVRT